MRSVLILIALTIFSTGCEGWRAAPAGPSTCPPPVQASEAAKDVLRQCCTVMTERGRRPVTGSEPLWGYLADVAQLNERLRVCREKE